MGKMKGLHVARQASVHQVIFLLLLLLGLVDQSWTESAAGRSDDLSPYNFTFTVGKHGNVDLTFKQKSVLVLTVTETDYIGKVELVSADEDIFILEKRVVFHITEKTSFPYRTDVHLRGIYLGQSALNVTAAGDSTETTVLGSVNVNVQTPFRKLGSVATIILTIWLVISYVIMAAKVEPRELLQKIKPPWGIIMGMFCQFILMPPLAFGLAKVFGLTGATAIGLILVGTCPGGFFSNIEVLLLDCDIVLSLTMTTFSTFLAVGMMPLNLLIYAQPFVDRGTLETPFKSLLIQLCGLVLPLVIGVPFFQRFPKARKFCLKLVKPFTFILMLLGVALFIPSQYYIFFSDWKTWTTSAMLPLIGAFLGMSIARIANFKYIFSITVAIETGCQNTLLAVSVAKLYYKEPESDIVAIIPLLIAMVTGFEGILVAAVYTLVRLIRKKMKEEIEPAENDGNSRNRPEPTADAEENSAPTADSVTGEKGQINDLERSLPRFRQLIPTVVYDNEQPNTWAPTPDSSVSAIVAQEAERNKVIEHPKETLLQPHGDQPVAGTTGPAAGTTGPAAVTGDLGNVNNGFVIDQHVWL